MQGYTYSVFSIIAIAVHVIINFNMLVRQRAVTERERRYRGFLLGMLAYYVADGAWGILAGLEWTRALYVDTALFFLSLVLFAFMWSRFIVSYLSIPKWQSQLLTMGGWGLLAFNLVLLIANPFTDCFYYFDGNGTYLLGPLRDIAILLLIAYNLMAAAFVFAKAIKCEDVARRRGMMMFISSLTITASFILQVILPLTPFTSLGCLICNCFLHVFVVADEQSAKHTSELEKALGRARAAEKARSMFFSIVSHDIRTPLNAILGYSEILLGGVKSEEEKSEALKAIRASGTTLLQLVNDVLDLAKMDAGKLTLKPEPLLLSQLTDEVFSSFHLAAASKGVELVNRTDGVPAVMLDSHRFRQVLFNLVGNAVKFTQSGSVTVVAKYSDRTLDVSVTDTGCGIAPDMLSHVLDPFVQVVDPSHSRDRAVGTGLGLSICRRLVEVMGGELLVQSELGKGSTFRAHIPGVAAAGRKDTVIQEAPPSIATAKLPNRILVIDDSPVNRAVMTAYLKKAGAKAFELAGDGGEGLAKLDDAEKEGKPFDFVLTDFWMPNMNGLEFIEKLRAQPRFGKLRVFAVTADTEAKHDARANLFDGILLKPLTFAKLLKAFASL